MATLSIDIALSAQLTFMRSVQQTNHNLSNGLSAGYQSIFDEPMENVIKPKMHHDYSFVSDIVNITDLTPGKFISTDNPLHVYLSKSNAYFMIKGPQGTRYTRSGAFTVSEQGQLVTADGRPVLSANGGDIFMPEGEFNITISPDGTISTPQQQIGQLGLVRFDSPQALRNDGDNLLETDQAALPVLDDNLLAQFGYEGSNVNTVQEINRLTEYTQYFQQTQKFIESEFELLSKANDSLLRISSAA